MNRIGFVQAAAWVIAAMLALAISRAWLSEKFPEAPAGSDGSIKRLAIEKPGQAIAVPDFALENLSGKTVRLRDFRGKVVFLNFWATWCVPCREEMPAMERVQQELQGQGLVIVAVNFRDDKEDVRKYAKELGLSFTVLLDFDGDVSEQYGAWSLPLTYFITRDGKFAGKAIGARNWKDPEAISFLENLLRAPDPG